MKIAIKDAIAIRWVCTTPRDLQPATRLVHEVGHVVQGDDSRSGAPVKHIDRYGGLVKHWKQFNLLLSTRVDLSSELDYSPPDVQRIRIL